MWLALLSNWKAIVIGGAIIAVFGGGWHVRGQWDESRLESKLKAQEAALHEQCDKDKKITEESNAFYQKQVDDITLKLNKYSMLASKCVAISSDATNLPASRGEPARPNGLSVGFIRHIAAQGDEYRAQRMTCDKYFEDVKAFNH